MFKLLTVNNIGKSLISGVIALASMNAQAELVSYKSNGVDLVYSSVSDVIWTKDANLIYSMIKDKGFDNLVNSVIAANSTSTLALSASDFEADPLTRYGMVSWYGGMAFANYLNSISYAGRNNWRLPTVANTNTGWGLKTNDSVAGDELTELFYKELSGLEYHKLPNTSVFDNEQFDVYWTGTELSTNANNAWFFMNNEGNQQVLSKTAYRMYAWFVSPSLVSTVPEPETMAMLFSGLGFISLAARRRKSDFI